MTNDDCPRNQDLQDWLAGLMPVEVADPLFAHMQHCPSCQAKLQTLNDATDTLIDGLRRPLAPDTFLKESQFQEAVTRAKAIGDSTFQRNTTVTELAPSISGELGEYRILEKLGEGGMGTVYKAVHTRLDRTVALKVLPSDERANERTYARLEREMKAVGSLDHFHIVRALDAREIEGTCCLVLEYIDGIDLAKLVQQRGPLAVGEACRLICQAATGLQHAHEHGLIHRDVKPSNLMVDSHGQLKILDLGLARWRLEEKGGGDLTRIGQTMGTAEYMAPEQASDSHSVDQRADIYSLGCTLHYLLIGRPPYPGDSEFRILTSHHQSPIPSLLATRRDIPRCLDRVFQRMLAKTPAARQASMSEVVDDLQRCRLTQTPEDSTEAGKALSPSRQPIWKTRRAIAAQVGIGIVAAALLAGLMLGSMRPEDRSNTEVTSAQSGNWLLTAGDGETPPLAVTPFTSEQAKQHQLDWANYLGLPVEWENSLGMQFVLIPPGEFLMGSSPQQQERFRNEAVAATEPWTVSWIWAEGPQHRMQINQPFYLGKCEVTQSQWETVMGHNPANARDRNPTNPVTNVSWYDIRQFLRQAGANTLGVAATDTPLGRWAMTFALPTEAQWEFACRAGTETPFFFGDNADELEQYAWFIDNAESKIHEVGQLKANAWGLFDTYGNVWEWCADHFVADQYARAQRVTPEGAPEGPERAYRGGCFGYPPCYCRSAVRCGRPPDFRYPSLGFRLIAILNGKK